MESDRLILTAISLVNQQPSSAVLTAAFRELSVSLSVNALCPYLLYQYLVLRFPAGSMAPLAYSSAFPIVGLIVGFARRRYLDFIALLALVEIAVALLAIVFSNSASQALIGRSLPNGILALIFLASVLLNRPIMSSIARQFLAGSDKVRGARFDQVALAPGGVHVFRIMTLVWTAALLIKCAVSVWSATALSTSHFLLVSPAFNYALDVGLVIWCIGYGRANFRLTD